MVVAGLLGALLTLAVLREADRTHPVLVAADDLAAGQVVTRESFAIARLRAEPGVLASLLRPADLDALSNAVTTAAVREGALVARDAVTDVRKRPAARTMSFALPRSRAVDGALESGDRVDVVAAARDRVQAGYVATDVAVVAASAAGSGPLQDDGTVTMTLAVDSGEAVRIAAALERSTVTLIRATGATPARIEDFHEVANAATSVEEQP
jgi:Flp pilus assembly protein CpaB